MPSRYRKMNFVQDQLKTILEKECISEEIRHMPLALISDLQSSYLNIERGRNQWVSAIDAMSQPVFLLDADYRVVRANLDYAKQAGMSVRDVVGKSYWQVFPLMDGPSEGCVSSMHLHREFIEALSLPTGQLLNDHSYTIYNDHEEVLYSLHVLEDITQLKQLEAEKNESAELFRAISEAAHDAIILLDELGQVCYWNSAAERIFGYNQQEIMGKDLYLVLAPKHYPRAFHKVFKSFTRTELRQILGQTIEFDAVNKKGDDLNIELSMSAVQVKERWHSVALVRDITARKQDEQKLRLFRDLLDNSNDAIEVLEPDTLRFLDINEEACRALGYSREELLTMRVFDIDPALTQNGHELMHAQASAFGSALFERTHQRKDGSIFPVEISMRVVEFDRTYILSIARDITLRKQDQQQLRELNRQLSTLSHVNRALIHYTDEYALLQAICSILIEKGGYAFVWVGYAEQNEQKQVRPMAFSPDDSAYLDAINITWKDDESGSGPAGTAIRTCLPSVAADIETHSDYDLWREKAIKSGYRSSIALPLLDGEKCFGVLNIYSAEPHIFDELAENLLMEMANDLAFGIVTIHNQLKAAERDKQMRALIEHNPDAILMLDAVGNIEFTNPVAEILLGQKSSALLGKPFALPKIMDENAEIQILSRLDNGKLKPRTVEVQKVNMDSQDEFKSLLFLHDITPRLEAEQLSYRMGRILEHSWNEIYVLSEESLNFIDVSEGGQRHLGYSMDELQGMTPLDIKHEMTLEQCHALVEPLKSGSCHEVHFESNNYCKDGSVYPVETRLQLAREESPPVYIAIVQDISERKQHIADLEYKAQYDALTGLPNRSLLEDKIKEGLSSLTGDAQSLTVLTISIRRMNEVNDLMGYQNGDKVLQTIASRLQSLCPDLNVTARLGADVFVLLLPKLKADAVHIMAEKIQRITQSPIEIDDMSLEIEVAIGIALSPEHGDDANTLLKHSDIAMRSAKHDGVAINMYSFENDPFSLRKLKLHGELRRAIDNRTLTLFYQPQVDISSGHITSVEALARWIHPEEGMISPGDFIPMIEQTGLIYPFTQWVLEEAITQLKNWADKGIFLTIGMNLSARNLLEPNLVENIHRLLNIYQVDAGCLCVEITESSLMRHPDKALGVLNTLHDMGIRLSIDDFGTGYSSLAYLKKLPMDELKIDQAFIFNLCENQDDVVIVQSTIGLAHSLGLKVVAEGIESKEVLDKLRLFGCDNAQGYYMSRPLPLSELELWLEDSQWGLLNH